MSIPKSPITYWVRAAKEGTLARVGNQGKPMREEQREVARLKREVAELKMERDFLKKSSSVLWERAHVRYALMRRLRLHNTIPFMCRMLHESPSGYSAWLTRPPSKHAQEEGRLEIERGTFGPERLQQERASHGITTGIYRTRRLRKKLGIRCWQVRKFKATTDSNHTLPLANNRLNQKCMVTVPNQVWGSDITYIGTDEGWLYCPSHRGLFTGEIVGYALGSRRTRDLVINTAEETESWSYPPFRRGITVLFTGLSKPSASVLYEGLHEQERQLL